MSSIWYKLYVKPYSNYIHIRLSFKRIVICNCTEYISMCHKLSLTFQVSKLNNTKRLFLIIVWYIAGNKTLTFLPGTHISLKSSSQLFYMFIFSLTYTTFLYTEKRGIMIPVTLHVSNIVRKQCWKRFELSQLLFL